MNRFETLEVLQQRTCTCLKKVQDTRTGKVYLAKSIPLQADLQVVNGFLMEVEVLSAMSDPRIPALVDVYEEAGSRVLVETWLPFGTLKDWLDTKPKRQAKEGMLLQAAQILEAVHKAGYVYLDIKPENFVTDGSRLWLVDFNSCVRMYARKVSLCSLSRMAPELQENTEILPACDVYAFGLLMEDFRLPKAYTALAKRLQASAQKRMDNMEQVQAALLACRKKRKLKQRLLSMIILSVFTAVSAYFFLTGSHYQVPLYSISQDPLYFIEEFEGELSQGSSPSSVLYRWIDQNLLTSQSLEYPGIAGFICLQALESQNASLCAYVRNLLPETFVQQQPVYVWMLEEAMHGTTPSPAVLNQSLTWCLENSKDPDMITAIVRQAAADGIQLEEEEKLQAFVAENHLSSLHCAFLEYLLVMDSSPCLYFDAAWLCQDENEQKLYEMYSLASRSRLPEEV